MGLLRFRELHDQIMLLPQQIGALSVAERYSNGREDRCRYRM